MTDAPADSNPQGAAGANAQPQIRVLGQYAKDLSFENPSAPRSLRGGGSQPNIDMSIDVRAQRIEGDAYEVELHLSAKAMREEEALFVAELVYAGLFQVSGVSDPERDAFLLIEGPRIIFPFARRVLADATRDGGFPPLMLEPVDFAALYRRQLAQRQQQAGQPAAAGEGQTAGAAGGEGQGGGTPGQA